MQTQILNVYSIFGKCLEIKANNGTKLIVTLSVGPRVVYYGTEDVNFFFHDVNNDVNKSGEYFDTNFKKGEFWKIYGGHRLWKSPEDMASYAPDNYPVEYEITEKPRSITVTLTNGTEKMTGLAKELVITMDNEGKVTLVHAFTNNGDKDTSVSLWCLSVMAPGGKALLPLNTLDTGLLANRNLVFWAYSDVKDNRFDLNNEYLTIRQDKNAKSAFKLGTISYLGKVGYYLNECLFTKSFSLDKNANYPDYSCNTELYTNCHMLEIESISPLTVIAPSQKVTHTECWSVADVGVQSEKQLLEAIKYCF